MGVPYVDHKRGRCRGVANAWYASMKTNFSQEWKKVSLMFHVKVWLSFFFLFSQLPANILSTYSYPFPPSLSLFFSLPLLALSQLSALGIFMHISRLSFDSTVYTSWQIKQLVSVKEDWEGQGAWQTPTCQKQPQQLPGVIYARPEWWPTD